MTELEFSVMVQLQVKQFNSVKQPLVNILTCIIVSVFYYANTVVLYGKKKPHSFVWKQNIHTHKKSLMLIFDFSYL